MSKMKNSNLKQVILISAAILCFFVSYFISRHNYKTTHELALRAENKLHEKELIAKKQLEKFARILKDTRPKNVFKQLKSEVTDEFSDDDISYYLYENDSVRFWTNNQPAVDLYAYATSSNIQLINIRNGWYEYIRQTDSIDKPYTAVALIAIKPEFDIENKYFVNKFSSWLELPDNTQLNNTVSYLDHAVKSRFGNVLFEIYRSDGLYRDKTLNTIASFFAVFAILFAALFVFQLLKHRLSNKGLLLLVFGSICFIARTVMIYFKIPEIFYNTSLYDVRVFANADSFYFTYLGDVLVNSILIFSFAVFVYKTKYEISKYNMLINVLAYFVGFSVVGYFSYNISELIKSLINNSTVVYNINDFFAITWYSLIGLFSVALLMYAFYLLLEKSVLLALRNVEVTKKLIWLFFISVIVVAFCLWLSKLSLFDYLWPVPFVVVAFLLKKYKATYNFINIGLIVLISTIVISGLFYKYEAINKKQNFDALSLNLADRQDIIAENEFNKISNSLKNDVKIKNLLSLLPLSADQFEQSLRQVNFSGYFERYEIVMSLFKNDCSPVFKTTDPLYLNEDYFSEQIKNDGYQTICDDLYFIDKPDKPIRYIARVEIEDFNKNPEKTYRLYIQFEPRLANNLGSFPDLLLDKSLQDRFASQNISYAVYQSNKLQTSFGDYQYPIYIDGIDVFKQNKQDEFKHNVYNNQKSTAIIISDKRDDFWRKFTSNSYLFIFFSLVVLCSFLYDAIVIKRVTRFNSLNNRIQFIFVSLVVTSLAGVVWGTVWVVSTQFENNNKKELIAKSQSVLKELQQSIGQQTELDPVYKDYTAFTLKKLAQLFGSDISLFNKKGYLFSTSQPTLYEQGLVSRFMDPDAYAAFSKKNTASYSHKENVGQLNYLSAYIPFYGKNDKLLGYINLPYFSRQKDLEGELTAYLTTLINVYTILFAVTTLVALLVSNLLTMPLRIIKQQISKIQFGKTNEPLVWKTDDEIGNLVNEYNTMLVKLEKSTELLAQSERETAWREMAKQVAHEIKNPLTPMKLNIQHLQRVADSSPEDITERVHKVSEILIEQIDTLSHIATEFSNFAKLPKANLEVLNVYDVLQNVVDLFQQNTNCQIKLFATNQLYINADREQCIRVFTNLFKNAEQAIPEGRDGLINVVAFENDGWVRINVKDNGVGISPDVEQKLFTPNFTTKSTGTGLGLAMVKNIIQSFNGTISYVTEVNVGTVFTINLPLVKLD